MKKQIKELPKTWVSECGTLSFFDAKRIAVRITEITKIKITPMHFADWYDGTGNYSYAEDFDAAATKLLGVKTYEYFNMQARLFHKILYALEINTEKFIGGINMANNYD